MSDQTTTPSTTPHPTSGPAPDPLARRLLISGKVQGVWYRASAQREAVRLSLSGWVRNLSGGEVEALVAGPEEAIDAFLDWARQGPSGAEVLRIEIQADDPPAHDGFHIAEDA
ncbi:MAG: acylphosphatase [Rhodocyclaceae bacterium]|jgi:acylphosphatase|nr:acylphosphatase [Rhodocyclaceae bacterium]